MSGKKRRILFLCTGNSCRSQMAEGFARAFLGDSVEAHSAGTEPHGLNPLAVRAMQEVGADISSHQSKHIDEVSHLEFDRVFTVCDNAREACPTFPGRVRVEHVGFDDPPRLAADAGSDEEAMQHYRRVRDEISAFIRQLAVSEAEPHAAR